MGSIIDGLVTWFVFECLNDFVIEVGYVREFVVVEDNTNNRMWVF